ncbi:MAG: phosphatase PAP2 family protein [Prevotella sp.]
MNIIIKLFEREKKPHKGLLAAEWVVLGYLVVTLLLMFFTYTKLHNPESMLFGRIRIVAMTFALWLVYRMWPCRLTHFARIGAQMALLSWWYPDTYEFNRMFPNLDHIFATWEQQLFGFQPSLVFASNFSHPVISELMNMGYAAYFPMIAVVTLFYFFCRYAEFGRATFVILASFFTYYIIYIALPVTGPQYYYHAVGIDEIAQGIFPNVHDWFATHDECLSNPGCSDGFFYNMVANAHNAGERPTAAFPSSHVGVSTILMLLAWRAGNKRLLALLSPFYVLLCLSTVYIYAHYAIDVLGGWLTAVAFFYAFYYLYPHLKD